MRLVSTTTPERDGGKLLGELLSKYSGRPILMMLSGGSSLSLLEHVDSTRLGPHITITTLDERFSHDSSINTFAQITQKAFYEQASKTGANFIPTTIEPEDTLETAGARFDTRLRTWKAEHSNGVIIATVGIGADGHTAGIFPTMPKTEDMWTYAYQLEPHINTHTKRITVTPFFLKNMITAAVIYVVGEEKRSALEAILENTCPENTTPACALRSIPEAVICTSLDIAPN